MPGVRRQGGYRDRTCFHGPDCDRVRDLRGLRYNQEALACTYKGKNIVELLSLTASQALEVFEDAGIRRRLKVMKQVGLSYLTLGQPLGTLSGGERQRIKLAKKLGKRGKIIVMDEPTTGLHMSDIQNLMELFDMIVSRDNTLVVIEHNLDVMKQADWIIDIGPDGGKMGARWYLQEPRSTW